MMADFHDMAQRAGEALAAAALVEAEARLTGGGPVPCGSASLEAATGGGARPVWIDYSTGSDRRGSVPSGSGATLATPPPELAAEGCDCHPRDPLTYPTTTRGLHRGRRQR
jgi:hypothetical protein